MQSIRSRVFSILNRKTPDRLPWFGDLSYWYFAMSKKGIIEERYKGFEGFLNLHEDLKVGFYMQGTHPFIPVYKNCTVTEVKRKIGENDKNYKSERSIHKGASKVINIKGNNDIIREVSTPIGTINEKMPYLPGSFCWAPKEYFIKTANDLKVFKYWLENTDYEADYDQVLLTKKVIGEKGVTLCYLPRSPLLSLMISHAGVTNTINLMMDHPKLFDETIKVLGHKADEVSDVALNSPAEFIMIPENLTSDMVGKIFYEKYIRAYEEKWNKRIKSKDKYSFIHFDGYLKGLLKEVSTAGFSVIEAMTPKPIGDLEINEFSNYVKSDSIMWGGIPGSFFTPSISDKEFEEFVLKVINVMVSEPRYVLGIADQVPPDGIIERVKTVSDLVEKYGIYESNF